MVYPTFHLLKHFHLHVVGASWGYELPPTFIWEEILHLLPTIKMLTVHFVGPEACSGAKTVKNGEHPTYEAGTCPDCQVKGRKKFYGMFGFTYQEYAQKYLHTKKHSKPHMIVAFNTGMY